VPERLEEIVAKCLTKAKDERYQTAKDLLIDLRNLRRKLDVDAEIERTVAPQLRATSGSASRAGTQGTQADAGATSAAQVRPTSSAEFIVTGIRQHKLAAGLVALVLIAGTVGLGLYLRAGKDEVAIKSIAVMPFVNESGNADAEYLSDGMTETLISSLSQLPNLNVKARSSVFRYKGKDTNPQMIGKELNVQAVLNGRVIQRGEQLTLTLELVDARTENVIWSERYNRKPTDLVSLQSEIARDVSSKLKSKLSGADVAKVAKNYTANTEAYQLYLKGRFYWNKRTPESLRQAIEFYNQAIERDPNYALAYSGLAETYVLFSSYSVASAKDSMPQAKAAALRALALDDSVAEAHTALGNYLNYFELERSGSEKEYRRAIELNPNYATAYQWLGADNLVQRKRFDEAIAALRRAEELDPLSSIISMNLGLTLIFARRYDEGIAQLNRTVSLDPNFAYAHIFLGWAFHFKGMYSEAIAEYRRGNNLTYDPINKGFLALSLAKAGQREEATKLLSELKQESTRRYVPSYAIALACIGLNEKEDAFVWLEKQIEERGYWSSVYGVAPELDELRDDPRFKEMLKRLNLPE
jgi:TolB-like protein/Tfp pilus assembly protein PilF